MTCYGKVKKKFSSYDEIVSDYIAKCRQKRKVELKFYAKQPSIVRSIEVCAMAIRGTDGKRHNHQRLIPKKTLQSWKKMLLAKAPRLKRLKQRGNFNELFEEICNSKIKGIGELTVYDTALRIGAYLNVKPLTIYLHAGTRKGAQTLGMDYKKQIYLDMKKFNKAFQRLKAYEIEDCLCIYKDNFKGISA